MSKEKLTIYWAPAHALGTQYEFSHLYPFPVSLYEDIAPQKADLKENRDDFLRCPAVSNKLKKTFVFRSTTNTHVKVVDGQYVSYWVTSEEDKRRHQTTVELLHQPTLQNRILLNYLHPVVFFAEADSLMMSLTPPYFHQTEHSKYGVIVPGEFDIVNWFRPINFEFQLWEGIDELIVPAGEPLGYVDFQTNMQIELRRFNMTNNLGKVASSLIHVSPHRRYAKLSEKYKLFRNARISQGILREIRDNLVD